jgi:hypothetical protein
LKGFSFGLATQVRLQDTKFVLCVNRPYLVHKQSWTRPVVVASDIARPHPDEQTFHVSTP